MTLFLLQILALVSRILYVVLNRAVWQSIKQVWALIKLAFLATKYRLWPLYKILQQSPKYQRSEDKQRSLGQGLVKTLLKMGPGFIKFGQLLSTRPDLIGEALANELKSLQDKVPPMKSQQVINIFEQVYGKNPDQVFKSWNSIPIASASIAQVHRAIGMDGKDYAVKILRPHIKKSLQEDLVTLRALVSAFASINDIFKGGEFEGVLDLLEEQINQETDLRLEASLMEEFSETYSDFPIIVPKVNYDLTQAQVLVMTFHQGTPIDEINNHPDRLRILTSAYELFFHSVLEHGFFHGDQHPGNLHISQDGRIIFYDFGIMGRMPLSLRLFLGKTMYHLMQRDYHALAQTYVDFGFLKEARKKDQLATILRALAGPMHGKNLRHVSYAKILKDLLKAKDFIGLKIEPLMFLLQKNMIMAEGTAQSSCPDFDLWSVSAPMIERWQKNPKRKLEFAEFYMKKFYTQWQQNKEQDAAQPSRNKKFKVWAWVLGGINLALIIFLLKEAQW